jgi:hypothetical protein
MFDRFKKNNSEMIMLRGKDAPEGWSKGIVLVVDCATIEKGRLVAQEAAKRFESCITNIEVLMGKNDNKATVVITTNEIDQETFNALNSLTNRLKR